MIRVLLAADQALMRTGFRMILDTETGLEVVGEASDGRAAITQARALKPDVVLMDVQMPGVDGLSATRELLTEVDCRDQLTERELEILRHVAAGHSNAEIAADPVVGEATVTTHVSRMLMKLGCATGSRRSSSPTRPAWSSRGSRRQGCG
jgi:DNA-binding NarL/FixJ family response regulator